MISFASFVLMATLALAHPMDQNQHGERRQVWPFKTNSQAARQEYEDRDYNHMQFPPQLYDFNYVHHQQQAPLNSPSNYINHEMGGMSLQGDYLPVHQVHNYDQVQDYGAFPPANHQEEYPPVDQGGNYEEASNRHVGKQVSSTSQEEPNDATPSSWTRLFPKQVKNFARDICDRTGRRLNSTYNYLQRHGNERIGYLLQSGDPVSLDQAIHELRLEVQAPKTRREIFLQNQTDDIIKKYQNKFGYKRRRARYQIEKGITEEIAKLLLNPATFDQGANEIHDGINLSKDPRFDSPAGSGPEDEELTPPANYDGIDVHRSW